MKIFIKINLFLAFLVLTGCGVTDIKSDIKSKIKSKISIDKTAPVVRLVSYKQTKLKKVQGLFTINSSEGGEIIYEDSCKGDLKRVVAGDNRLTFSSLADGYYDFCKVSIMDNAGNYSKSVQLPAFYIGDSDKIVISEVTSVAKITSDSTPSYTFRSTSDGTIIYKGACKGKNKIAFKGNNTVIFNQLQNGVYKDCYLKIISDTNKISNELHVTPFEVNRQKEFYLKEELVPKKIATLDSSVSESSGMIVIDGKIYTHNDSSDKARIFEIDSFGNVIRKIDIIGAVNIDWEAMTQDDNSVYIADIGNNLGNRVDLKIYKIDKYQLSSQSSVECKVINIKYAQQELFDYKSYSTPFDAEAIIAYQDKLYIFTKNWSNKTTYLYRVEKEEGSYILNSIDEYSFDFLITDAVIHKKSNSLVLIGYNSVFMNKQKIVVLSDFENDNFFSSDIKEFDILNSPYGFKQIEAVSFKDDSTIYITSETVTNRHIGNSPASLFEVELF